MARNLAPDPGGGYQQGGPPPAPIVYLEVYATECYITDQRPEGIEARLQALVHWRTLGNQLKQGENLTRLMALDFGVGQTASRTGRWASTM